MPDLRPDVANYAAMLTAAGRDEREVARCALYAQHYGLERLSRGECVFFDTPDCGDWNCLNPEHQVLVSDA